MFYAIPDDFMDQLYEKYDKALHSDKLKFNGSSVKHESHLVELDDLQVELQYTVVQSLMHRPEKGDVNKNPFEDPEPELTVLEDFGDNSQFRIVYNKFPVVPRHIMMLTKNYKPQTTPLSADELAGCFSILETLNMRDSKEKWFGFYNCGPESGASQPHKHVQFMTLPNEFVPYPCKIISSSEPFIPNDKHEPLQHPQIPYAHFIVKLPDLKLVTIEDLVLCFSALLQRTLTALRNNDSESINYNVILTTEFMMMVPRVHGKYKQLGINSCGILGLFLFKNDELLNLVKQDTPLQVWKHVGVPNTAGESIDEYNY